MGPSTQIVLEAKDAKLYGFNDAPPKDGAHGVN